MAYRWYSSISDFDDLIRFRDHLWEVYGERKPLGEKEFPGSIEVYGKAYAVLKEKVLLEKRRQNGAILGAITTLFTGPSHILMVLAGQVADYLKEYSDDRKNEIRKAASIIAGSYYHIETDTEYSMKLVYVYRNDNHYEDPPTLY